MATIINNPSTFVPTIIKENPLKSIAALITSISVIVSAVLGIDSRYAHADEIKDYVVQQQKQLLDMQRGSLDDKVFELEIRKASKIKEWTPTDDLLLERYKSRLKEIDRQREINSRTK